MHNDLRLATKLRVRVQGRAAGLSRGNIRTVIDGISEPEDFARICVYYQTQTGAKVPTGVVGEGETPILDFFKWFLEWLASPEGQNFIRFIFMMFGFAI